MKTNNAVFSLVDVMDAIDSASEDFTYYANTQTGEISCYVDPMIGGDEFDEDDFEGDEWINLPDKFDRDDWGAMRDFAYALGGAAGDELLDAIHGSGAFRSFRRSVERMNLLSSWHAYKDERTCRIAVDWLESNGLSWKDDRHESWKRDWHVLLPDALRMGLGISVLDCNISVCKFTEAPADLPGEGFLSVIRTDDELTIVCETESLPKGSDAHEDGWRALKVNGPLDFSLAGILAKISTALAEAGIPIFVLSTYETDYVLVKEDSLRAAIAALRDSGCEIVQAHQE